MRSTSCFEPLVLIVIIMVILASSVFVLLDVNKIHSTNNSSEISLASESYWTIGKNMSSARNELAAVELNGYIYALGGEDIGSWGQPKKNRGNLQQ